MAAIGFAALLGACASTPMSLPGGLSGRLAVQVDAHDGAAARSGSTLFDLRGDAQNGELQLSSPLGSMLAQARWSPGQAVLSTPDGSTRYDTLDDLAQQLLGERLPLAALIDWLHGRPWAGAPSQTQPGGFAQLDWSVDTSRFDDGAIVARRQRAPAVTVRARMDGAR
jgi:outer membrane lipoprotein LolB